MLTETFRHCHGIATTLNRRLLEAGCHNWQAALHESHKIPLGHQRKERLLQEVRASAEALAQDNIAYLIACFPTPEKWRILSHYWQDLAFLDIETTGLSPYNSHVTVAALWQGGKIRQFIRGQNLPALLPELERCKLLVTFAGGSFDLPRLMDCFHIPEIPCPHIDLRWQCYHEGLVGGLKKIEDRIGLHRPPPLKAVDGYEAIGLWQRYQSGHEPSLTKLLAYVSLDVLALGLLTAHVLGKKGNAQAQTYFLGTKDLFQREDFLQSLL